MSADQHKPEPSVNPNKVSPAAVNTGEVADNTAGSALNSILWTVGLLSLVGATLANQYLPEYWVLAAQNVWVKIGAAIGLAVFGILALLLTKQGRAFPKLMSDSQTELRRVTWPDREETLEYTWKTLLVMVITGVLIWILDGFFNVVVGTIIGS